MNNQAKLLKKIITITSKNFHLNKKGLLAAFISLKMELVGTPLALKCLKIMIMLLGSMFLFMTKRINGSM